MVSTGRSAASPETLETRVCAVISRGRRTIEDVRRWDLWSEDGEDSGVDGPSIEAVVPGEGWMPLLAIVVVSPTRLTRSAEISAMAGMARFAHRWGTSRGAWYEGSACPPPPAHISNQPLEQEGQSLIEWLMVKIGQGEGWGR